VKELEGGGSMKKKRIWEPKTCVRNQYVQTEGTFICKNTQEKLGKRKQEGRETKSEFDAKTQSTQRKRG